MYHKLLRLATLCFIIQLCFVNGFPTADKTVKDAAEKVAKDATETIDKATKDATESAKKALEDVEKQVEETEKEIGKTEKEIGKAATAATNTAIAAPQITQEELDTFMALLGKAATTSGDNNNPLQRLLTAFRNAPNPIGMLQSFIAALGPLSGIFQSVIDGLTNIYLENRERALEFSKTITDPFLQMSRFALTPFGVEDTADKIRSAGFKFGMTNADIAVQAGNDMASTAPTFMKHIERNANGLIKMPSLNF